MRVYKLIIILIFLSLLNACKKEDGPGGDNGGNNYNYGSGAIYIKQGTEGITRLDMSTGVLSQVMGDWSDAGWDISWDGTKGVKEVGPIGFETTTHYIFFNTSDGSTIKNLAYEGTDGHDGGLPEISPDGTKLALTPTFDDGLVILDMNGRVLKNIIGYGNDHTFEFLDPINWAADGSILFKKNGSLYRTTPMFTSASKIRDIPFSDWRGEAVASPDGTKIALSVGNHIWLMNTDGSDFHQITESTQGEYSPSFSPDSKYIAIKANSRASLPGDGFHTATHLCLVPADGQVHKVYPGEDNKVIQVKVKGQANGSEGLGMGIVGDFVWRQ